MLHESPEQLEATLLARLPHHMGPSGAAEGTALLEGLLLQAGLEGRGLGHSMDTRTMAPRAMALSYCGCTSTYYVYLV